MMKDRVQKLGHPLCIGFDPDVSDLHPFLRKQCDSTPNESFLLRWYQATLEGISAKAHSIKIQSAFFEQFGSSGMDAMRDVMMDAKRRGLHTILDAKRGDISTTMAAYGKAAFDHYQADCLTILPWMGTDSLAALTPWLKNGKSVYIVWLSSNASGRAIQMIHSANNSTVARELFQTFHEFARNENLASQIGWVIGATNIPEDVLSDLPEGEHSFLLPGIGAQGARFDHVTASLVKKHPASLFPISRGILKPEKTETIHSWQDYSQFVAKRWNGFIAAWTASQTLLTNA